MSKDYYKILEVDKSASKDEIKKAFRKKAHEYHPDKKTGDEAKFKEINEAYQVLSDDNKRAQYDRFGSAGPQFGGAGGQGFGFDFSNFQGGNFEGIDLNEIFGEFFDFGGFGRQRRGRNIQTDITISLKDSVLGCNRDIVLPENSAKKKDTKTGTVNVKIPAGVNNGEVLKMQGYGEPFPEGRDGDLYIRLFVTPEPGIHKDGMNLIGEITLKPTEALLGKDIKFKLFDEEIDIKIPEGMNHNDFVRVRGKGVRSGRFNTGDLLLRVKINTPSKLTKSQKKLLEELQNEGL